MSDTEYVERTAFHTALLELIVEKRERAGRPVDDKEARRLSHFTEYDLSNELRALLRVEAIVIPAGTVNVRCRWCDAEIYWVGGYDYKRSVSVAAPGWFPPTGSADGLGCSHLADCPQSGLRFKE